MTGAVDITVDGESLPSVGDLPGIESSVKQMLADDRYDDLVPLYSQVAATFVINRLFPMDKSRTWDDVPSRYASNAALIAVFLINKRGAEGETQHEENGTKRVYTSSEVPTGMLSDIVPFASVPK